MDREIRPVSNISSERLGLNYSYQSALLGSLNHNMTMAVLPVTVFIVVETLIGFVGNILILVINVRRREKSNFRYFVISMACIDLTSCITALPLEVFSQMNWYTYRYASICKVKSYFNVFTAWASASVLFLLAFDRYRKVRRPLKWQVQPSFAIKLCITSLIFSAIVAIPAAILWGIQIYAYNLNGTMINVSICEKDDAYADEVYPRIYIWAIYSFPVTIMMLTVCTLNFISSRTVFCTKSKLLSAVGLSNASAKPPSQSTSATDTLSTGIDSDYPVFKPSNSYNDIDIEKPVKDESTSSSPPFSSRLKEDCSFSVSYIMMRKLTQHSSLMMMPQTKINIGFDSTETNNYDALTGSGQNPRHTCSEMSLNTRVSKNSKSGRNGSRIRHSRPKQKMVIMLVLTLTFVVTMMVYVILTSLVAKSESVLIQLHNSEKAVFFFFWRLYFINTVVNPILYGLMDSRFRSGLKSLFKQNTSLSS